MKAEIIIKILARIFILVRGLPLPFIHGPKIKYLQPLSLFQTFVLEY